jgi:hypothetical protein
MAAEVKTRSILSLQSRIENESTVYSIHTSKKELGLFFGL